jgi:hypothetical protein
MVDMLGDLFQESRIATPMAMIQVTTSNSISSPLGFDFQITLSQYMRYKLIQVNGLWTRLNLNALDRARFRVSRVTVVVEEEIKQDTETPGKARIPMRLATWRVRGEIGEEERETIR